MRKTSIITLACSLLAALVFNGVAGSGGALAAPAFAGYPPSVAYDIFGRCLSPNCPDYEQLRRFLERYERNYGRRLTPDKTLPDAAGQRRDVAPTPVANIQPRYRHASQIRPEFVNSGRVLDRRPRVAK